MDSPTRADIKADTETLVHELEVNPSNADILQAFKDHTSEDHEFQDKTILIHGAQAESMADMEGNLAKLETKIDGLATKEDIRELKEFMKNVKIGEGIVRFTFNNSAKIGSLALFILGIFVFFKVGLAGAIAFFMGNPK